MASSFTSLHSLPTELLEQIMALADGPAAALEDQMFAGRQCRHDLELRPFRLSAVCRPWRQRILSTPELWRRVYLSFASPIQVQLQYLNFFLQRSDSATPLHVFVAQAPGTVAEEHVSLVHVLQAMLARVQRLTIWSDHNPVDRCNSLFAHIHQATPLLQSISIRIFQDSEPDWGVPHRLLTGAPLLAEVYLYNVPLLWFECSYWEHVVTVTLVDCTLDLENLVEFGNWWPTLQKLAIEQVTRHYKGSSSKAARRAGKHASPAPRLSPLPRLKILELRTSSGPSVFYRARTRLDSLERMLIRSSVSPGVPERDRRERDQEMAYFFEHCAPNLTCLTIEKSFVSRSIAQDVVAAAPCLRELHLVDVDLRAHFFTTFGEHRLPSLEELSFYECRFHPGAPVAFAQLAEQACLPLAAASSSARMLPRLALKRLRISQISKIAHALPLPILNRIRAAIPFAEIEEIQDF